MGKLAVKKETQGRHLAKKDTALTLVKQKPKQINKTSSIKKRASLLFGKTKSAITGGQRAIKKGAKASSNAAKSAANGGGGYIITKYLAIQDYFKKRSEEKQKENQKMIYGLFLFTHL